MKDVPKLRNAQGAQTIVFFAIVIGLMCLLCGLAIDSGLLYLAKARLSRAVDGAALAAVGNFQQSNDSTGRLAVATIMRDFAVANYLDLATISTSSSEVASTYTTTSNQQSTQYTYTFYDPSPTTGGTDSSGAYRRYVQVVLQTGAGGQITSGQCNARCPAQTYFIGMIGAFKDLKVSSSALATRNPRLIMVVVDRSASMLAQGGGATGLPAAVTTFLNFFDTSSDYIGIVSFSSAARLEMALTTNFLYAGTNDLYDSYQTNTDGSIIPGVDPEEYGNVANYMNGIGTPAPPRRLKFGGQTAADEGLRLAIEQLMQNPGFTNPNVVKYIVLFTDGAWNTTRTLLAAPGYTNIVTYPAPPANTATLVSLVEPASTIQPYAASGTGFNSGTNNIPLDNLPYGYVPVPIMSPWPDYSNSITYTMQFAFDNQDHNHENWQSIDASGYEPLPNQTTAAVEGNTLTVNSNKNNNAGKTTGYLFTIPKGTTSLNPSIDTDVYTSSFNVWIPPGAVDYVYGASSTPVSTYVSCYTNAAMTANVTLSAGQSNVLIVPGYITDGIICDNLDLPFVFNAPADAYPLYRHNNYNEAYMWPDDSATVQPYPSPDAYQVDSVMRNLMFRNYANLLTGYYIFRPDDPLSTLVTDTNPFTGQTNALNGNGPYYPSAAFYWPFDLAGVDWDPTYNLINATSDPDPTGQGQARHVAYSINMLSSNAAPEYAGELFYEGTGGTNTYSSTTAVSSLITQSGSWQSGAPSWFANLTNMALSSGIMTNEASHFPTNIGGAVWRPVTFNGSNNFIANSLLGPPSSVSMSDPNNKTGGYVTDGAGNYYRNTMAYSGRPTHYFDFSTSKWMPIPNNHVKNNLALPLGIWKAREYAWHARAAGVTIFTVGYGTDVTPSEQDLLAQVANATNSTANTGGTNFPYNPNQPIGQEFYASTPADISNDFYLVGTAINGALTQ